MAVVNESVVVRYNGVQADWVAEPGLVNWKVVRLPSRSDWEVELCESAQPGQSGGEHHKDVAAGEKDCSIWTFHVFRRLPASGTYHIGLF